MQSILRFLGAAWVTSALLAQQSQFQGSVPTGTASDVPLALTMREAVDRGLKANLGLLVSDRIAKPCEASESGRSAFCSPGHR